jgi:hypothetical protein
VAAVQLREGGIVKNETLVRQREVTLVDLVDRLLGGGVVIAGDITLSVADVDLVRVSLRALISSVASLEEDVPPL